MVVKPGDASLRTSRSVAKGEPLLSVPESAWITPEIVRKKSALGTAVEGLEPWLALTLWLLHERSRGDGAWGHYLTAAASADAGRLGSPLLWSPAELALLEGSQLAASTNAYRAYFQQRHAELAEAGLLAPGAAAGRDSLFSEEACSFDAFLRAACAVRARVLPPLEGPDLALVPLAGLLRHARAAPAHWRLRASGLFGGGREMVLEAVADMAAGQAVAVDCGPGKTDGQARGAAAAAAAGGGAAGSWEALGAARCFGGRGAAVALLPTGLQARPSAAAPNCNQSKPSARCCWTQARLTRRAPRPATR